ncbi:hypothetical protein [uncultured Blautia sp.]|uniref:hypothetical protein n=1 Tax=Lachnospiraceae TaxID=186803 RepID=UPI00259A8960|nr:hypothetical protein [uncultured Blautia sp.]
MEIKNICGKIPVELHEKLKLEVEELGISIPKYLEMVIEEHMTRKGEKTDMANLRTVAVQVDEELFSRLKAVLAKNGMKQKDFLIGLIEEALEKEEAKWKAESAGATEPEEAEPAESEPEEEPELKEAEAEEEPTESEAEETEPEEEPTETETEEPEETESAEVDEEELETEETEPEATEPEDAEE